MPQTFPPPPYCYCETSWGFEGARMYTRFFFLGATDANTQSDTVNLADWYNTTFVMPMLALLNEGTIHYVSNGHIRTTTQLFSALAHGIDVGTVAGEGYAAQNTLNITWSFDNTGGGTRMARGRTFLSGWSESQLDDGNFDGGFLTSMKTIADGLMGGPIVDGVTFPLMIWRPAYNVQAVVQNNYISPIPKVLRHRRPPH